MTKKFTNSHSVTPQRLSALAEHLRMDQEESSSGTSNEKVLQVNVDRINANPFQPRKHHSEDDLTDLASSIQNHGILQPLVGRPEKDGTYTLIAGHRRWMAARKAKLLSVPVMIRKEASDDDLRLLALVENIQREELHAADKARALKEISERFPSQKQAAAALGMQRSALSNWLRVTEMSDEVLNVCAEIPNLSLRTLLYLLNLTPSRRLTEAKRLFAAASINHGEGEHADGKKNEKATHKAKPLSFHFKNPEKQLSFVVEIRPRSRSQAITLEDYREALQDSLAKLEETFANALASR